VSSRLRIFVSVLPGVRAKEGTKGIRIKLKRRYGKKKEAGHFAPPLSLQNI
jgi:hypothetical protein